MSQQTATRWIVAAALGFACGCHGPAAPLKEDPLLGGRPVPIAKASGVLADDPVPMPASDVGRSPAALTSAGQQTLPKETVAQTSANVPASNTETYEQLQERLRDYGVTWQRLRTNGSSGSWIFECGIPEQSDPNQERNFQAQAVGPNGLAAIRAVLTLLEADRKEHD